MTISASTNRPLYDVSRAVTINAYFILGSAVLVVAGIVADFIFAASIQQSTNITDSAAGIAHQQFAMTCLPIIYGIMLVGIGGSAYTLAGLLIDRLAIGKIENVPIRVKTLGTVLLVASVVLGLLSLLYLMLVMPRFLELFKYFGFQLPGLTIFYLSFVNFITNPINCVIVSVVLISVAVFLLVKGFLLKDTVVVYMLNAFIAFCLLIWLAFAFIAALQAFVPPVQHVNGPM